MIKLVGKVLGLRIISEFLFLNVTLIGFLRYEDSGILRLDSVLFEHTKLNYNYL